MYSSFISKSIVPIFLGFILFNGVFADEPMIMDAPTNADGLKDIKIKTKDCVPKEKLTADWLNSHFHIKDQTITLEIMKSNDAWPGPCSCPYNLDGAKQRCGGNSHYSQTNSLKLTCYPKDVLALRKH